MWTYIRDKVCCWIWFIGRDSVCRGVSTFYWILKNLSAHSSTRAGVFVGFVRSAGCHRGTRLCRCQTARWRQSGRSFTPIIHILIRGNKDWTYSLVGLNVGLRFCYDAHTTAAATNWLIDYLSTKKVIANYFFLITSIISIKQVSFSLSHVNMF